ncbi:S-adenosyl-L-methionine-dependent methyltransferase [Rickenella mellea]|uniref:S-adenosyl-L-methionine-dependent methyltransferase n=1 Tax=Rickenella mellea TaxID=50990 RepID=A0A4Y7Q309_9AGAM|nr:S-adenosyl-L-methionine-dependent methyltransferase [Rickenella mellea]
MHSGNYLGYGYPGPPNPAHTNLGNENTDCDADDDDASVGSASTRNSGVHSYRSSQDGLALFRNIDGRTFNTKNELYFLPADEQEHSRQDKQHHVQLHVIGGLYIQPHKVQTALTPKPGEITRILDLGSYSAQRMAQEFPHAKVIGIDLAPSTCRYCTPPFAILIVTKYHDWHRFEFDDFTKGLPHYHDSFDVVHSRATANGISDFPGFIEEAARCLKPGGILLITEGSYQLFNERREPQAVVRDIYGVTQAGSGESWFARMVSEAYVIMHKRGSAVDAAGMSYTWMTQCPLLEDCGSQVFLVPIGPWDIGETPEETRERQNLGILTRQVIMEYARALRPLFLTHGYPPEVVDRFIFETDKELSDLSVRMYMQWHYSWATRTRGPSPSLVGTDSGINALSGPPGLPLRLPHPLPQPTLQPSMHPHQPPPPSPSHPYTTPDSEPIFNSPLLPNPDAGPTG